MTEQPGWVLVCVSLLPGAVTLATAALSLRLPTRVAARLGGALVFAALALMGLGHLGGAVPVALARGGGVAPVGAFWLSVSGLALGGLTVLAFARGGLRRSLAAALPTTGSEQLSLALEAASVGVLLVGADATVVWLSPVAQRITGWDLTAAIGRPLHEVVRLQPGRDAVSALLARRAPDAGAGAAPRWERSALVLGDNGERPVLFASCPWSQAAGRAAGAVVLICDGAAHLDGAREVAQWERQRCLRQLARGFAHDLGNALTALSANLFEAQRGVDVADGTPDAIRSAADACDEAVALARRLQLYARSVAPHKEPTRLDALARACGAAALAGTSVGCTYHVETDEVLVEVNDAEVRQALTSVVAWLAREMPAGGELSVVLRAHAIPRDDPDGLGAGRYIELAFGCRGVRLDRHTLEHLFEPYIRDERGEDALALATAYSVIERHGGRLRAVSDASDGTVLAAVLPAARS